MYQTIIIGGGPSGLMADFCIRTKSKCTLIREEKGSG